MMPRYKFIQSTLQFHDIRGQTLCQHIKYMYMRWNQAQAYCSICWSRSQVSTNVYMLLLLSVSGQALRDKIKSNNTSICFLSVCEPNNCASEHQRDAPFVCSCLRAAASRHLHIYAYLSQWPASVPGCSSSSSKHVTHSPSNDPTLCRQTPDVENGRGFIYSRRYE